MAIPRPRPPILSPAEAEDAVRHASPPAKPNAKDRELFRGQMLTEMARMSVEDGMVMQIHPGCWRNHNALLYRRFGGNIGGDMPARGAFMAELKPLLDRFGNQRRFHPAAFHPG